MLSRIALVTNFPSHYQVDLFNVVAAIGAVHFHVFYLREITPGRQWTVLRTIQHEHTFVPQFPKKKRHSWFYLNPGFLQLAKSSAPEGQVVNRIGAHVGLYSRKFSREYSRSSNE